MTALSLAAPKTGTIPPCTPHLMPFHIAYTGPAPVSTYFRLTHPKTIPTTPPVLVEGSNSNKPTVEQSDSQATLVSAESQQTLANDVDMLTLSESTSSTTNNDLNGAQGDVKGMTAAFRGRTVRGLTVALPEGYTGLVFASPSSSTASSSTPATSNAQRSTRNSKYFRGDDKQDQEEEDGEEERPTRKLEPTGRFTSFALWNADIPVHEGRDEYLRALTEWTRLAAVINQYDEDV
ncbi:ribonuclease H2, subunit C [Irpex lacteus]|nr:ribonuclease H2, subunit C [Irpex lacteus]